MFGAENASSARARVLCGSSVEDERAGGVCVFCVKEALKIFLLFFSQARLLSRKGEKEEVILERQGDERARRRVRVRVRVRKREKLRVELIKQHVVNSNKQNVIQKPDSVQVFSPSERG